MAKKASGRKNQPAEILDDNGTLIAGGADEPDATARGADGGERPAGKNRIPKP